MHIVVRTRRVLAVHPWIHWAVCVALAVAAAVATHGYIARLDAERRSWGTTREVWVTADDVEPGRTDAGDRHGDARRARAARGTDRPTDGAVARQRVTTGEILVDADVATATGPAALAAPGTVVVGLVDPLARNVAVGATVEVSADGVVVCDEATVVAISDEVIQVGRAGARRADRRGRRSRRPGQHPHPPVIDRSRRTREQSAHLGRTLFTRSADPDDHDETRREAEPIRTTGRCGRDHGRGSSQWWPTTTPRAQRGEEVGRHRRSRASRRTPRRARRARGRRCRRRRRGRTRPRTSAARALRLRQRRLGVEHLDGVDEAASGELARAPASAEVAAHRVERMGDVDQPALVADRRAPPRRGRRPNGTRSVRNSPMISPACVRSSSPTTPGTAARRPARPRPRSRCGR